MGLLRLGSIGAKVRVMTGVGVEIRVRVRIRPRFGEGEGGGVPGLHKKRSSATRAARNARFVSI